jgi:hypothetical protein
MKPGFSRCIGASAMRDTISVSLWNRSACRSSDDSDSGRFCNKPFILPDPFTMLTCCAISGTRGRAPASNGLRTMACSCSPYGHCRGVDHRGRERQNIRSRSKKLVSVPVATGVCHSELASMTRPNCCHFEPSQRCSRICVQI